MEYEYSLPAGAVLKSGQRSYVVVETLGAGGFGITYKVTSTIMVDNVPITTFFAVKEHFMKGCYRDKDGCTVLSVPNVKDEVEQGRKDFIVEAQRLNRMSGKSQNIVSVNEVFEYFGTAYYVMQYLDGGELADHLNEEGAMSESRALSIIRPIAEAVKLIHKERLLHLDIKPGNIVMMTEPGTGQQYPVLIDFGISKHFSASGKPTSTHSAKGASDGYAPMEQYSTVDRFAPEMDVYALGATLLHLLSGETPKNAFDINPEEINAMLPDTVSKQTRKAILLAMDSKKTSRTQNVDAFLVSLEEEYALPIGFILKGETLNYRITGIQTETDSYIVYNSIALTDDEMKDAADGNESSETRSLYSKKDADKPVSFSRKFLVYECFSKAQCKRQEDGSVTGQVSVAHNNFEKAKAEIPIGFLGTKASNQLPLAECFTANGTDYFAYMVVSKAPAINKMRRWFRKHAKHIGYSIGAMALIAGMVFGSVALIKSCGTDNEQEQKGTDAQTPLSDIDSAKIVKELAEKDSMKIVKAKEDSIAKAKAEQESVNSVKAVDTKQEVIPQTDNSASGISRHDNRNNNVSQSGRNSNNRHGDRTDRASSGSSDDSRSGGGSSGGRHSGSGSSSGRHSGSGSSSGSHSGGGSSSGSHSGGGSNVGSNGGNSGGSSVRDQRNRDKAKAFDFD